MITDWKIYTESYEHIPEYILKIHTQYIGSDEYIDLFDFSDNDYYRYKMDKLTTQEIEYFKNMAIDEIGLEWEIDEDKLIIRTKNIGEEDEVQLDNPYDIIDEEEEYYAYDYLDNYSYDELDEMAYDTMGIEWEIIPNEEHPDYEKKKTMMKYNL